MRTILPVISALALLNGFGQTTSHATRPIDPALLSSLHWRSIGPAMFGGRVVDVAGVPGKPDLLGRRVRGDR